MINLVGLLLVGYVVLGAVLYLMQRSLIYFPTPEVPHDYETLRVESGGESLHLAVVNRQKRKAILYFGGNAEVVVNNGPSFEAAFPEHTVYLVNYRGYGGSSGKPTEAGLFADALQLYDQLAQSHDNIAVIGRSLGTGVAVHLAAERPVRKLVLVTPFDSILNVARSRFPVFPLSLLLKDHYNSAARSADINADVLVLIAEHDEVIPRTRTDALMASFDRDSPAVVVFDGAGHNDISLSDDYNRAIADFVLGDLR